MSAMTGILRRHVDKSGVSGTGDVAELAEFSDGAVAVRWHGPHPSTACWNDIRDVEIIHGHQGATEILFDDNARLVRAYQQVMRYALEGGPNPCKVAPHPDHPDRLQLAFKRDDETAWRRWIALLDGTSHAATHEEVNAEMRHRWITPDGDLWLEYSTPLADDNDPLTQFDREDR